MENKSKSQELAMKLAESNQRERNKIDALSTFALSISFFTLGVMTQYYSHARKWNKFVDDVNKLGEAEKELKDI